VGGQNRSGEVEFASGAAGGDGDRAPSFRGGMNSLPSFSASGTAERTANSPMAMVDRGLRSATKTNGL